MALLKSFILLGAITIAAAEVVDFKQCSDDSVCTINKVSIDPCPEATEHLACLVYRRRSATMTYEFTPHFTAEKMEAGLFWAKSATEDLPLITMDKEACKYTSCPTVADQRQTYSMEVPVQPKFPMSFYTIKWTLTSPAGELCCFTTDIKVVR